MGNNGEELENKISWYYLPQDYIRMMNFGMAKNFFHLFSPSAKWCCPSAKGWCPSGKSIEFFFSHSNFVLRSRKKTQWTFLQENTFFVRETKLNGLSFMTPAFCFRRNKVAKKKFFSSLPHPSNDLLAKQSPISILLQLKFFRHLFVFIFRSCPVSKYQNPFSTINKAN